MNPFSYSKAGGRPALFGRLQARPAPIVFVLCLLLGFAAVAWRTRVRSDNARAAARTEALARGTAVERQFDQALAAAEVLAALVRQGNGAIADFQKVATGVLAAHPGLASLELEPAGTVSEVAPRAGHDRAIGRNVLSDPAQGPGARAAVQSRSLTVSGPLTLDEGMLGIVARVPVFPRGRDGREYFWGFAAVSVRLPEALSRARVDELFGRGYHYAFFAPASAQQRAVGIKASGKGTALQDTVQQPVRAENVEFRLALQPRSGWVNRTKVVLELLGVLFVSGLLCLLVSLLENRHAVEAALADANQRLDREAADRKQAQADCLSAREQAAAALTELKPARAAQRLAESAVTNLQARLEAADRSAQEAGQAAQARQAELEQAQQAVAQMQSRLEAADRGARDANKTAEARRVELEQAQQTIAQMQSRLDAAARAATEAAAVAKAELEQARATIAELRARPEPVVSPSAPSTASVEPDVPPAAPAPALEPPATEKPPKPARRKKGRSTNQMDLFGSPAPPEAQAPAPEEAPVPEPSGAPTFLSASGDEGTKPTGMSALQVSKVRGAKRERGSGDSLPAAVEEPGSDAPSPQQVAAEPAVEAAEPLPGETAPSEEPVAAAPSDQEPIPVEAEDDAEPAVVTAGIPTIEEDGTADEPKAAPKPSKDKPAPVRRLPVQPPVNPAQLRKAVNLIVPLLTDSDPGAKDCLKDNRPSFRSAFTPEGYVEFEQLIKDAEYATALELMQKAVKKHGISV